jgi:hypothetical protein
MIELTPDNPLQRMKNVALDLSCIQDKLNEEDGQTIRAAIHLIISYASLLSSGQGGGAETGEIDSALQTPGENPGLATNVGGYKRWLWRS